MMMMVGLMLEVVGGDSYNGGSGGQFTESEREIYFWILRQSPGSNFTLTRLKLNSA